jgi:thiol-disulfide isomerase/thioredoxin
MTKEEIHSKYSELQKEWNNNIKNKAISYAMGTKPNWSISVETINGIKYTSTKPAVPGIIAKVIAETVTIDIINEFQYEIDDLIEKVDVYIYTYPTFVLKKEWILERLKEIRQELTQNENYGIECLSGYPESVFSENVIQNLFGEISNKSENNILHTVSSDPDRKTGFYYRELLEDFQPIDSLNQLAIEFEILTTRYKELTSVTTQARRIKEQHNPYPIVFSSELTFDFFMYCISEYSDERIKPALFAKYYLLFKDENLIIGHKLQPYKDFAKKEFNVEPGRPRTDKNLHPEDEELENFKLNFKMARGINNIE